MNAEKDSVKLYDKASKHFMSGGFPDSLPIDQAYVHIGMYLGWIVENYLYSQFFEDECDTQIIRFKRREISPAILSEIWNGSLGSNLFTEEGNMFTYYYYGGGLYNKDYISILSEGLPSIYHVKDSWENFDKISVKISQRFEVWKNELSKI
ncbi:MAG: hypothetical protein SNJ77_11670 [Cytophagales bacterium]